MANVEFPEGPAEDALRRLTQLHPGLEKHDVVIRAMTAYHCLYELYLEGKADDQVTTVMEFLDSHDHKKEEGEEWQDM